MPLLLRRKTLSEYISFTSVSICVYHMSISVRILFCFSSGISSLTFTKAGEALYLYSSSELQRISLSASKVTKAHCALNLPPNARSFPETNNEETQEQGVVEGTAETEGDTTQGSQPDAVQRMIMENGVVGSSEYTTNTYISFFNLYLTYIG